MTCYSESAAAVWPEKDPADKLDYAVDFEGAITNRVMRGRNYSLTMRVRPSKATGYEYECTTAGQTGWREPKFPMTIGATVVDGSVVWTCRALSNASLSTTVASTPTWSAPGLTLSGETLIGQRAIAYIEGGEDGQDYSIVVTATMADGSVRTKVVILPVRRAVRVCRG